MQLDISLGNILLHVPVDFHIKLYWQLYEECSE